MISSHDSSLFHFEENVAFIQHFQFPKFLPCALQCSVQFLTLSVTPLKTFEISWPLLSVRSCISSDIRSTFILQKFYPVFISKFLNDSPSFCPLNDSVQFPRIGFSPERFTSFRYCKSFDIQVYNPKVFFYCFLSIFYPVLSLL